jgi:hypothetical protein
MPREMQCPICPNRWIDRYLIHGTWTNGTCNGKIRKHFTAFGPIPAATCSRCNGSGVIVRQLAPPGSWERWQNRKKPLEFKCGECAGQGVRVQLHIRDHPAALAAGFKWVDPSRPFPHLHDWELGSYQARLDLVKRKGWENRDLLHENTLGFWEGDFHQHSVQGLVVREWTEATERGGLSGGTR